jgi:lipoprotein signal peptidase
VTSRRSAAVAVAFAVLAAVVVHDALASFALPIRSSGVVLGAGIAAGGALATFVSGLAWGGVPDPLVRDGIAFNLADVAIAVGDALVLIAALLYAWANRARLREPV